MSFGKKLSKSAIYNFRFLPGVSTCLYDDMGLARPGLVNDHHFLMPALITVPKAHAGGIGVDRCQIVQPVVDLRIFSNRFSPGFVFLHQFRTLLGPSVAQTIEFPEFLEKLMPFEKLSIFFMKTSLVCHFGPTKLVY